jgi:hypothetical protein
MNYTRSQFGADMSEKILMHHNGDTGEVTIYSAYTDKMLFHKTEGCSFREAQLVEIAVRDAEKAAIEYTKEMILNRIEDQIKQWRIS